MTAHHAVLVTEVIEREPGCAPDKQPGDLPGELSGQPDVMALAGVFRRATQSLAEANERFVRGDMDLVQRATAEARFHAIACKVRELTVHEAGAPRDLRRQLDELLADRVFCNFSVFQSVPDVWAIDQVFPVMPLHRLGEDPQCASVIHDLTCDSDGRIGNYVDQYGAGSSLWLHGRRPDEPYLLGIFLVGAYQEILGDMHNLFGDTDAVNIEIEPDGAYRLAEPEHGDTAADLLRYVHFDPERMLATFLDRLRGAGVTERESEAYYRELSAGLDGYTYLFK